MYRIAFAMVFLLRGAAVHAQPAGAPTRWALSFEGFGPVTSFRSGKLEPVGYIEGCL